LKLEFGVESYDQNTHHHEADSCQRPIKSTRYTRDVGGLIVALSREHVKQQLTKIVDQLNRRYEKTKGLCIRRS